MRRDDVNGSDRGRSEVFAVSLPVDDRARWRGRGELWWEERRDETTDEHDGEH